MKSRDGKSQRREEKKKEDQRRKSQKKEDPGTRKGRKVAKWNTVFFRWFVAPEGRNVGSLKPRVRSHLGREMKNCTPLWRQAHFDAQMYKTPQCRTIFGSCDVEKVRTVVARSTFWSQNEMYKTPQCRTTFGSCDVEKVCAVVARSTFPSQNVRRTSVSDRFWKLRCRKSARRYGAKHMSKSKCTKKTIPGPLLEVDMSKKCTPLWRKSHFEVKMYKENHSRTTFGSWHVEKVHAVVARITFRSQKCKKKTDGYGALLDVQMPFCVAGARDCAHCQRWEKREQAAAGVGHLKRICKDAFSVAGAVQETCSSEMLGGPVADFLRGVAFLSIRSSVLGRWFCVTGAALRMTWLHFFVAGAIL